MTQNYIYGKQVTIESDQLTLKAPQSIQGNTTYANGVLLTLPTTDGTPAPLVISDSADTVVKNLAASTGAIGSVSNFFQITYSRTNNVVSFFARALITNTPINVTGATSTINLNSAFDVGYRPAVKVNAIPIIFLENGTEITGVFSVGPGGGIEFRKFGSSLFVIGQPLIFQDTCVSGSFIAV